MKSDIEILFTRFRNELPIIKSKDFLEWCKLQYPNFVGVIIGYFLCALMVIGKISDLELENLQLRERLK